MYSIVSELITDRNINTNEDVNGREVKCIVLCLFDGIHFN